MAGATSRMYSARSAFVVPSVNSAFDEWVIGTSRSPDAHARIRQMAARDCLAAYWKGYGSPSPDPEPHMPQRLPAPVPPTRPADDRL
jgi:hypothetical protein